ncbi:MAG: hypothetical protein NVSMB27_33870 [Ktedonobacteraceae bacterium]
MANTFDDESPTAISDPSHPALWSGGQGTITGSTAWLTNQAVQHTQPSDKDEEEERRRRALLLGLPLLGGLADIQPSTGGVPMVHGTPQFGGVPMVQGNPTVPMSSGSSFAQSFQGAASSGASPYAPSAAPQTPLPSTGGWHPTHPATPTTGPARSHKPTGGTGSSGSSGNPGSGCGPIALILVVIFLVILGSLGGLYLGLPPNISVVGSPDVASGGILHLHGNNFVPGSGITLSLDNGLPLFASTSLQGEVSTAAGSSPSVALPMTLAGQLASQNSTISASSGGTFDVAIPVSTSWSLGSHTIRAREAITARSTVLNFSIVAAAAQLVAKPSIVDFGKIELGGKSVMSVVVSNNGGHALNWQATSGGATWPGLQPASGTIQPKDGPQFIYVTADTGHLKVGIYTATLQITSNGGNAQVVVKLEVVPASPKPYAKINVTPTALDFGTLDAGNQLTKTVTISNTGTLALNWKADTGGANWVTLDSSAQTIQAAGLPDTINVRADTTNLAAGTHNATLNFTSNGGNVPVAITVVVNVPQTNQPCTLQAPSSTSETFDANMGSDPNPATQNLAVGVSGSCASGVTITPAVTNSLKTSWLTVTPPSATITSGSTTFVVKVTSQTLAPGTYSGSISLGAASGGVAIGGSPQMVGVTLNVTEIPPVLTESPGTLTFNLTNGDAPTTQGFTINNTGGAPLQWSATLDANAPSWVTLPNGTGSTLAAGANTTINVNVDPSNQQPTTVTDKVTVTAIDPITKNAVKGSPKFVTVMITITPHPVMQLSKTTVTFQPNCVYTASDSVTITNTGGGTLGWTVGDPVDGTGQPASWLTVLPLGNGSGNATITFNADGSKLQYGTKYTATVTITPSFGAPQVVSVTYTYYCIG